MKGFAKRLDRELNVMSNGVLSSYASDCIEEHYSKFKKKGYGTSITAMYGSKLRVIISIYSDSARTKLVSEYKMSTDSYPV